MSELILPRSTDLVVARGLVPQLLPVIVDGRQSVAEILGRAGFTPAEHRRMVVTIDDVVVPPDMWIRVKPKPHAEALMRVAIRPENFGGDGGGLKTVLGILLVAAAAAVSAGALGFVAGGALNIGLGGGTLLFGAGSFEASLAAAALLGLGQVGLNALFPSAVTAKGQTSATETGTASARQNVLKPGDYLPLPQGRVKMWPPQVCRPIRYFEGRDEVVEVLLATAGRATVEDLRVAGVPAADVAGLTVQVIDWNSLAAEQTLLAKYGAVKSLGRELQWYKINKDDNQNLMDQAKPENSSPAWEGFSFPDADEMRLRLTWTEGLNKKTDDESRVYQPMRVRIRPRGSSTWVNLPEMIFSNDQSGLYRKDIVIRRGAAFDLPAPPSANTTVRTFFSHVPGQGRYSVLGNGTTPNGTFTAGLAFTPQTDDWRTPTHFGTNHALGGEILQVATANVAITEEGPWFFISDALVPRGPVEVEIRAGAVVLQNDLSLTTYGNGTNVGTCILDLFGYTRRPDYYAWFSALGVENKAGKVAVNELVAIMHSPPTIGVTKHDATLIALRGRNVQVGDVTAILTSVVHDRATDDYIATESPAKLSEALARGQNTHRGVASDIRTAAYDAWHAECLLKDYRASFEVAGGRWDDTQKMLASAGRGGFAMARGFRPYFDHDRSAEAPVMAFNPANSRYVGLTRSWAAVRTDALRISYRDEDADYAERSRIVYAPGVDAASSRGLEDVGYPETASADGALARANYDLALARYRPVRLAFETDHAATAVEKGDLVQCVWDVLAEVDESHEVNERAASQSSYIAAVTRNGDGQITEIELERPVYVEPTIDSLFDVPELFEAPNIFSIGDPYVGLVTVGRSDPDDDEEQAGYVLGFDLAVATAGATTTIAISPADVPRADRVAPGQIFTAGRSQRLSRRAIVESITPTEGYFTVVCVPEAPEIWQ